MGPTGELTGGLFAILAAVERLPAVGALKASFYAYPLVNALHILSIGMLVGAVTLMDLRILGLARGVEREPFLRVMRAAVAVAFPVAVLTGLALFSVRAGEYAQNPAFQAKLALLALAGLNFLAFRRIAAPAAAGAPYPAAAKALAALSLALWPAILVAGRFIGFL